MDFQHVTITFEDTTSGAKLVKHVTRSKPTIEKMKKSIGDIVVSRFENNIRWNWRLMSIEPYKPQEL